jgi:probable F420-dependent oxidoreductase
LRYGDPSAAADAAAEFESLGLSALWVPDVGGDVFGRVGALLDATSTVTVATGILNLWKHEAETTAKEHDRLGERFLVGIGVSHAALIDAKVPGTYRKPLAAMRAYLDGLDAADPPLPIEHRVLAALGPAMLALARDRAGGAHPYLTPPEHTAIARAAVGPDRLVAPEQAVVFDTDPDRARAAARAYLAGYLALPNYANNLRRLGYTDDDIAQSTDRVVDGIVAWGDEDAIRRRVQAHRDAGADHVCIQVLTATPGDFALDEWRRLAPALT